MARSPSQFRPYPAIEMALGRVNGMRTGIKFGRNSNIDTANDPQDVWEGSSDYTGHPLSFTPETASVVSSSTADDAAAEGTGAWTIRIFGLKTSSSTEYESEDIALDGQVAVTSTNTWWRINRAYVLTAGSGGANAGTITINSSSTTANVFCVMQIGYNQTQVAAYTVPAGHTMVVTRIMASIARANGAAGSATLTFRVREPGNTAYRAARVFELEPRGPVLVSNQFGDVYEAGTDVKMRVDLVNTNNTIAAAEFEYVLVEND